MEIGKLYKQMEKENKDMFKVLKDIENEAIKKGFEVWRPIDSFDNYSVSTKGRVRNDKSLKQFHMKNIY